MPKNKYYGLKKIEKERHWQGNLWTTQDKHDFYGLENSMGQTTPSKYSNISI